jgi:hypothetical protein
VIVRALLLLAALAACAWLVVGFRASRLQAEADERVPATSSTPAVVEHKRDLLRRARRFNPGTEPLISEAQLLIFADRHREAARVLESVVDREPENYEAWLALLQATQGRDVARARSAAARVRVLSPLGVGQGD